MRNMRISAHKEDGQVTVLVLIAFATLAITGAILSDSFLINQKVAQVSVDQDNFSALSSLIAGNLANGCSAMFGIYGPPPLLPLPVGTSPKSGGPSYNFGGKPGNFNNSTVGLTVSLKLSTGEPLTVGSTFEQATTTQPNNLNQKITKLLFVNAAGVAGNPGAIPLQWNCNPAGKGCNPAYASPAFLVVEATAALPPPPIPPSYLKYEQYIVRNATFPVWIVTYQPAAPTSMVACFGDGMGQGTVASVCGLFTKAGHNTTYNGLGVLGSDGTCSPPFNYN